MTCYFMLLTKSYIRIIINVVIGVNFVYKRTNNDEYDDDADARCCVRRLLFVPNVKLIKK